MRFLLVQLLIIGFAINAFGQNIVDSGFTKKAEAKNQILNGKKEGKWCEYVKWLQDINQKTDITNDTNLAGTYRLVIYKAGKRTGIVREYHMNGKILGEETYVNGKENGMERYYYESGAIKDETPFVSGKEDGTRKTYYESGKLERETPFTNGKVNGIDKEYYENGQLKSEEPYYLDKGYGIAKAYYENGIEQEEWSKDSNILNGLTKKFYENGKLMSETMWHKGMEGETTYYNNQGLEVPLEKILPDSMDFKWADTSFKAFTKRRINFQYAFDGSCTVAPCYETRDNHFMYDTLVNFLKSHPSIEIEVASHWYGWGNQSRSNGILLNNDWSRLKANAVKQILIDKGISADRILAIGYGSSVPVVTEQEIKKLSKEEQHKANFKNTRIEIIIIDGATK